MTDDEFLTAFETGTLPKPRWTHVAHVRMAWLYLCRLPFDHALTRIRDGIRRYNAAVGTPPDGYHETITVAYARLIHARMREATCEEDFLAFTARCPELIERTLTALLRHYARETLFSPAAREQFVEPDLAALPDTDQRR